MNLLRATLLALALATAGSGCLASRPETGGPPGSTAAHPPGLPPFPATAERAPAKPRSAAYTDGYKAGVVHTLDGGTGPAPAPPIQYRLANYWDTSSPGADDWAEGFGQGAAAARLSGLRAPNARPRTTPAVASTHFLEPAPHEAGFRAVSRRSAVAPPAPPEAVATAPPAKPVFLPPAPTPPRVAEIALTAKALPERPPVLAVERVIPAAAVEPVADEFGPWRPATKLRAPSVVRDP